MMMNLQLVCDEKLHDVFIEFYVFYILIFDKYYLGGPYHKAICAEVGA
jgi:hypothetical protein